MSRCLWRRLALDWIQHHPCSEEELQALMLLLLLRRGRGRHSSRLVVSAVAIVFVPRGRTFSASFAPSPFAFAYPNQLVVVERFVVTVVVVGPRLDTVDGDVAVERMAEAVPKSTARLWECFIFVWPTRGPSTTSPFDDCCNTVDERCLCGWCGCGGSDVHRQSVDRR